MRLPKPMVSDGSDIERAMLTAVSSVTEQSFFAVTEPCDDGRFRELAESASDWLVARVRFEEGPLIGWISCTLSGELARAQFDAFMGRDASDPVPPPHEIYDLVGEFSNMVCGAWLSHLGSPQTFTLSPPVVEPGPPPAGRDGGGVLSVTVNDLPLVIDLTVQPPPAGRP